MSDWVVEALILEGYMGEDAEDGMPPPFLACLLIISPRVLSFLQLDTSTGHRSTETELPCASGERLWVRSVVAG